MSTPLSDQKKIEAVIAVLEGEFYIGQRVRITDSSTIQSEIGVTGVVVEILDKEIEVLYDGEFGLFYPIELTPI